MTRSICFYLVSSLIFISCSKQKSPEEVIHDYAVYMSEGKCEQAMKLCTGDAKMIVQGSIDAGCVSYKTQIDSVTCEVNADSAFCYCYEYREEFGRMKFPYGLIKIENQWKITVTTKGSEIEE